MGPAQTSTHQVIRNGSTITKRFVDWTRNEHRREWLTLAHLQTHAPGLAPTGIDADLDAHPPQVTMTLIAGHPLEDGLTDEQANGLRSALERLWAVPTNTLPDVFDWSDDLPKARALTDRACPDHDILREAHQEAVRWWDGPDPERLRMAPTSPVLGQRDANLSNYLWDGITVRLVDFEDAAIVDLSDELGLILEHLSTRHIGADRFLDGLAFDPDRLRAARRVWAMFWFYLLLPGGSAEARNPPGTARHQAKRLLQLLDS